MAGTKKEPIKFVILYAPITKKNSQRILINPGTKKPFIAQSEKYKSYEKGCEPYIKGKGESIDYPVNVKCLYYMPTRRRVDLVNLENATLDILTHYKVLADDNRNIVYSMDGSRVLYDKDNPRTEVTIEKVEEYERWDTK